jgi:hypothetical protein
VGEETKGIAYLCTECRVLIHRECNRFSHTIKMRTHDLALVRTYSLSLKVCELCYKKVNTKYTAYYCWECGYVARLHCAYQNQSYGLTTESVVSNSVGYKSHLVHLVEGINLGEDERDDPQEIKYFSHPQHNLILSNEELMDDMRCEACMQFIISSTSFYRCTQ